MTFPLAAHVRATFLSLGVAALLAASVASAQVGVTGNTGIDASGNTDSERAACMTGRTQQDQATCLREANNAAAEKRKGQLGNSGSTFTSNALARCDVMTGSDLVACQARVLGYSGTQGSVAGGGVIKESEVIEVPANPGGPLKIEPQTSTPVLVTVPGTGAAN